MKCRLASIALAIVVLPYSNSIVLLLATHARAADDFYPRPRPRHLTLVEDGQPHAVVVVPERPPLEVRHAANELAAYVRRMSGAELKIVRGPAEGPAVVLQIDPRLNAPQAGDRDWPGSRGYRLLVDGNRLHVIGSDALSVLFGVYGLLERQLGVRWLWPGELGEIVPQQRTVRVGHLDEVSVPDFRVRWVGSGGWALHHGSNAMVRVDRQPVGVKWKWHFHTFCTLIPAEKYYDQHPEWWPLVGGRRQRPTREHSHSTQLCTSNPEMVAEMTRNLIAVLDREPDTEIIALSPNDGEGFCECEKCRALDEAGRDWFARYSKRLAVLNREISREVAKRHPKVLIKIGAYTMYLRRPLDESLAPTENQLVQICHIYCCHNHPLQGDRCVAGKTFEPRSEFMTNSDFRGILADWRKVTEHLFIYEYYSLNGPSKAGLPWPLIHALREDIPYYHKIGAEGFYTQVDDATFCRYGMNYYLAAKLAWNSRLDVDALMVDYCRSAFGPAAGPMLAHFKRLEMAMVDSDRCLSYGLENPRRWGPKVFTADVMTEAGQLLDQAAAAVEAGPERLRIEFFKKGFEEARLATGKMKGK